MSMFYSCSCPITHIWVGQTVYTRPTRTSPSTHLISTWVSVLIDPYHKSHNASDKYPIMHRFVTKMYPRVHISLPNWCIVGYGIGTLRNRSTISWKHASPTRHIWLESIDDACSLKKSPHACSEKISPYLCMIAVGPSAASTVQVLHHKLIHCLFSVYRKI